MRFAAGLDLGQASDYSALVIIERVPGETSWTHNVRHIARWRGKPYPAVVAEVARLLSRRPLLPDTDLRVDATGVGRAVLDLLRQAHAEGTLPCWPREVTLTGADEPGQGGRTIPKRDLIAHLEVLLATDRLHVASGLTLAPALREELGAFRAKMSATGHATYEARGSGHDDLVIATALASWGARTAPDQVNRLVDLQRDLSRHGGTWRSAQRDVAIGWHGIDTEVSHRW